MEFTGEEIALHVRKASQSAELLKHRRASLSRSRCLPWAGEVLKHLLGSFRRKPAPGERLERLTSKPPPTLQFCDPVTWGLFIEQIFIELFLCDMHHVLNTSCVHFRSSETRLSGWLQLCHPVPCTDAPDCAPPWACLLGLLASCPWLP